ncbi:hypothetical protein [Streptomyces sp. 184]|uniref:hypothetical protein n=1 Tax=Streptomyces sp. 184 TaxID=1827526 RepID=UPI0038924A24
MRVEVAWGGAGLPDVDEHVRAGLHAPAPWARVADVLLAPGGGPADVRTAAARHPGALVVAAYRGGRCWLRYGSRTLALRVEVHEAEGPGPGPGWRWRTVASAVHAWLAAGLLTDPLTGPVRLRTARPPTGRTAPLTAAPPG